MSALYGFGFLAIFGLGYPAVLGLIARAEYRKQQRKEQQR